MSAELTSQTITATHPPSFWLGIAQAALRVLRPFLKLNAEQAAAWDVVVEVLGGL